MQDQQLKLIIEAQNRASKEIQALRKEIGGLDSEAEKLGNTSEKSGSKVLSGLGGALKSIAKIGVAATGAAALGVGSLAKSAVESFAEYEQLVGGVETLFKDSSDEVMKYAENAYKTAGMSSNEYMDTVTGFSASLLQGLKGDTAAAAKYADLAITDMSDNANKMGTDIGLIKTAYQGFAKQNYTMLDNLKLGYGGTKQEMERLLKDAEKLPQAMGKKFDISNYQDIIQAIHVVQENTGIAGTTQREAAETISGSLGMLKGAWSNLVTGLADDTQDFGKLLNNVIESIKAVAKNLLPTIKVALSGVVQLIKEVAPLIIAEIPKLVNELLPPVLEAAISIVMAIIEVLPSLVEQIFNALVDALPKIIDALVVILPQLLIAITNLVITIVMKLTEPATLTMLLNGAIKLFLAIVQAFPTIILALIEALPTIIESIISWLTNPDTIGLLIDAAIKLFMGIVEAVPRILGALVGAFGRLFNSLWSRIVGIFGGLGGQIANAIGGGLKQGINGVLGIIENGINVPFNLINGAIDIINLVPGVNIGKIPRLQIPRLYTGGIVEPSGNIIRAGDGGEREWVVPESKMASLVSKINSRIDASVGRNNGTINTDNTKNITQNFNMHIHNEIDLKKLYSDAGYAIRMA
nr:MAG TPA: tail tape measure protein [Caudoviricetes sp.]